MRLGPKRPPIAAVASWDDGTVRVRGVVAGDVAPFVAPMAWPYDLERSRRLVERERRPGRRRRRPCARSGSPSARCSLEGALHVGRCRSRRRSPPTHVRRAVLLDSCVAVASGALAGARVECDDAGRVARVHVRVAAGDPLDEVVLRSYAIGAAHMALGWVLTEGLAVDAETGEIHDLTIRSFGILRAKDTPPIDVEIVDDPGDGACRARPTRCSPRWRRRRGTR